MSRAVIAFDRVAALAVGVLLIVAGVAGLWWWRGAAPLSGPLDAQAAVEQTSQPRWPWIAGLLGAILVILGIRWLAGHLISRGVGTLKLPGSSREGRLTVEVKPVAQAACAVLETQPGVRSAHGTIETDRGQLVARLSATIEPHTDLADLAQGIDTLSADLAKALGREDLRCMVRLRVARRARHATRVT